MYKVITETGVTGKNNFSKLTKGKGIRNFGDKDVTKGERLTPHGEPVFSVDRESLWERARQRRRNIQHLTVEPACSR
jgi:hypothetical protein